MAEMTSNIESIFESTVGVNPVAEVDAPETAEVASKKKSAEKNNKVKEILTSAFQEYAAKADISKLSALSDKVEVVKTLAYTNGGGLVRDTSTDGKADAKRTVKETAAIVGYRIKNNSDTAITFKKQIWKKNPNPQSTRDLYISDIANVELKPGETMNMNRRNFAMFALTTESVAGTFANGVLCVKSSIVVADPKNPAQMDTALADCFFQFSKDTNLVVHSDEVKVQIGTENKTKDPITSKDVSVWTVNPEYEAEFGFLMNSPEKKTRTKGASTSCSKQQAATAYMLSLKEKGEI